jgi:hypothetical protein
MEAYLELQQWWARIGATIETASISAAAITELEISRGLILPADFKLYLRHAAPAREAPDHEDMIWWAFPEMREGLVFGKPLKYGILDEWDNKYLLFVDYAISCWNWAICCGSDDVRGKVAVLGGPHDDIVVAGSFSDFVHQYVTDPYKTITGREQPA